MIVGYYEFENSRKDLRHLDVCHASEEAAYVEMSVAVRAVVVILKVVCLSCNF